MLRRRAQYGTSEALLHGLHPDKRKRFPLLPGSAGDRGPGLRGARPAGSPAAAPLRWLPALWEAKRRRDRLREAGVDVSDARVWNSVVRSHLSMLYFAYFHLTRYYLGPLTALGLLARGFWWLEAAAVLYSSGVDYFTKRPRLPLPVYAALYLAEHAAYQTGVIRGCLRARSFRTYLPVFERRKAPGANAPQVAWRMIRGEKIYLTELDPANAETIRGWLNDPEVYKYLMVGPHAHQQRRRAPLLRITHRTSDDSRDFEIHVAEDGRYIGNIGLKGITLVHRRAEVGIAIGSKQDWGKGYGFDALVTLLRYAFDTLGLHTVKIRAHADHTRALDLYRRVGFVDVGREREAVFQDGRFSDYVALDIIDREFRERYGRRPLGPT